MMQTSRITLGLSLLGAFLAPLSSLTAASFSDMAPQLDTDGELVAYADFSGDSQIFGDHLTEIYAAVLQTNPQMTPIPLDFATIFDTLGFSSAGALGYSVKEVGPDIYRNRGVWLFNGEPKGFMALNDSTPRPFTAAQMAPAKANLAVDFQVRFDVLRDTIANAAAAVMGPMGQGMILGQLEQPLLPSGLTGNQIIMALSNPLSGFMIQDFDDMENPKIDFYLSVAGQGALVEQLSGLQQMNPQIAVMEENGKTVIDFSAVTAQAGMSLYVSGNAGSDLVVYTQKSFLKKPKAGTSLADSPAFVALSAYLPETAGSYVYSSGVQVDQFRTMMAEQAEAAAFLPIFDAVADGLLADFLAPSVATSYAIDGGLVSDSYASYSMKEALAAAPMAIVGLTAAMAVPAYQKVQSTSTEKAVTANLRQIASAAMQYMLDEGVEAVTYDDIVGPGKHIESIESVVGEDYSDIVVTYDMMEISVMLPSGKMVTYQF
jgi:Tfp pilus assembly protein PilE